MPVTKIKITKLSDCQIEEIISTYKSTFQRSCLLHHMLDLGVVQNYVDKFLTTYPPFIDSFYRKVYLVKVDIFGLKMFLKMSK